MEKNNRAGWKATEKLREEHGLSFESGIQWQRTEVLNHPSFIRFSRHSIVGKGRHKRVREDKGLPEGPS